MKWIRTEKPFALPTYVKEALEKLDDAGHIAYVVGGSVRDNLLGREAKDHDVATSAEPDELSELFPDSIEVGKQFGVIKIPVRGTTEILEIATFRKDLEYKDHRHPTGIEIAGPFEDAARRDFTMNALFYDPKSARILDTVGGIDDIRKKVIRVIGNPVERFREDALRLLRAVRFAATLGFEIEPESIAGITSCSKLINKVSQERIRDELTRMWAGPRPGQALQQLSEFGLLQHVLPEVESMKGVEQPADYHPESDVWTHTVRMLECLSRIAPQRSSTLAWGALLYDVGKPVAAARSGGKNFNGHEQDALRLASTILTRLRMPKNEIETVVAMVGDQLKFREVFQMREATLQRFVRQPHFEELLVLHRADASASNGNLAFYEFCASILEEVKKAPSLEEARLISGEDLITLGMSPGPRFSEILRTVEDLQMEKKLHSKEQALEYVVKHFVK